MRRKQPSEDQRTAHRTSLTPRIESMLTEARVLLPGAQALFGFQMAILFTERFGDLSQAQQLVHAASLCCIVLAVILLMAPATFHRIAFGSENTEEFFRLGSAFVIASAVPLALGISADLYVASSLALGNMAVGAAAGLCGLVALTSLWFVRPLLLRARA